MADALPNRKTVKADIISKMTTAMTSLAVIYDTLPKDTNGRSPLASVQSGPIQYDLDLELNHQSFRFYVIFWARRDGETGSGMTASDADKVLDDLILSFATLLEKYYKADFLEPSEIGVADVDGQIYAFEEHYVQIFW